MTTYLIITVFLGLVAIITILAIVNAKGRKAQQESAERERVIREVAQKYRVVTEEMIASI